MQRALIMFTMNELLVGPRRVGSDVTDLKCVSCQLSSGQCQIINW